MVPDHDLVSDLQDRTPIRVLMVDDHEMVTESMVRRLSDEPDIDVVAVAATAEAGIAAAAAEQPDVAVMDFGLPDLDGLQATVALIGVSPSTRVVLVTGKGTDEVLIGAIEAGCSGYVEKTRAFQELVHTIRRTAAGEIVMPPGHLARLLPKLVAQEFPRTTTVDLSLREREVLDLFCRGLSSKAVAVELALKLNTVRNHTQNILIKLGAHSKLEAVAKAARLGLIDLSRTTSKAQ